MYLKQLYTGCLAEAAYYIESEGEAAVIDPIRETEPYLELAEERNARIKFVIETHFHADFVSGHIDLAQKTGAAIVYGPKADPNYEVYIAEDGEELILGKLRIRVLHTPGHTLESTCYLLFDESGKEYALFSGDTLFVGDVGRPDLLDGKMSKEELASLMYDSLNNKIKPLPDHVILYPAHGPGSACGKNIGQETFSTIGEQKKYNYALKDMSRDEFIKKVTDGIQPPPKYFFDDARINKTGYVPIDKVVADNTRGLSIEDFNSFKESGSVILDTREPEFFEKGFIPGSLNIGLNGSYAIWAGTLIDINSDIILVTHPGKEEESVIRLARVGFENVKGYLDGGFDTWAKAGKEVQTVHSVSPEETANFISNNHKILDIRRPGEWNISHVKDAQFFPLTDIYNQLNNIDKNTPYLVYCATGYRSVIASSILLAKGYKPINVQGGLEKLINTSAPMVTEAELII